MDKEWEEIAKEENKHFEMLKKRGCTYPDCDGQDDKCVMLTEGKCPWGYETE